MVFKLTPITFKRKAGQVFLQSSSNSLQKE